MTLVAVGGMRCTTTAIGLASAASERRPATLVELDPHGGCAAAWLGVPRQPSLSEVVATGDPARADSFLTRVQPSLRGVDVLVAPVRAAEAAAAVPAASAMLPVMSAMSTLFVADVGRLGAVVPPAVSQAGVVVISHVQHRGSAGAAALGIEQLADTCATLAMRSVPTVVALHGTTPYAPVDVARFLAGPVVVAMTDDPWAAAVMAGRPGSARRLRRSAWWAAMTELDTAVDTELTRTCRHHPLLDGVDHG